jgi:hypothetical protein
MLVGWIALYVAAAVLGGLLFARPGVAESVRRKGPWSL